MTAIGAAPRVIAGWASGISPGPANEAAQALAFDVGVSDPTQFRQPPAIDPTTGTLTFTPAAGASGTVTVTVVLRDDGGTADGGADRTAPQAFAITLLPVNQGEVGRYTVGSGDGTATLFDPDGTPVFTASPFAGTDRVPPVLTATGDVTGDGVPDVVTGTGPGVGSEVAVLDGVTGLPVRSLVPFEDAFRGGVEVAVGDVDGDGFADVAVGAGEGGAGRVTVYSGRTWEVLADFFGIDDLAFRGGVRVSLGDVNGDGFADLACAAGLGGGPRVAVWDGTSLRPGVSPRRLVGDFFVFEATLRNGAHVSIGDLDGDGFADLIFGGGPGGAPRVFALDGRALVESGGRDFVQRANFFAGDPNLRAGARVAVKDLNGDRRSDLIVVVPAAPAVVQAYLNQDIPVDGEPAASEPIDGLDLSSGVFVG